MPEENSYLTMKEFNELVDQFDVKTQSNQECPELQSNLYEVYYPGFKKPIERAWNVFVTKHWQYGPSHSFFRLGSLFDQILIKAYRIQTLENKGEENRKVEDDICTELFGIYNYCIISLDRLNKQVFAEETSSLELLNETYTAFVNKSQELGKNKDSDYVSCWKLLKPETCTDMILVRIARLHSLLKEGTRDYVSINSLLEETLIDIMNYSLFRYVKQSEEG